MKYIHSIIIYLLLLNILPVIAQDKKITIYQDADLSINRESSKAIQKGIEVAFSEINNTIDGFNVDFKYLNHRGNVIRSKRNYQSFINDPQALVIYSGIHSPPLIKNRAFINENKALTLVPWAAGGPITRYPSKENWVFRLSVDDTQAGSIIIDYAMKNQQCKHPHLLLEESPWGNSNLKSMSKALLKYGIDIPVVTRFSWNLKAKGARIALNKIQDNNSDCIVLVSNASEGAVLVNEMLKLPEQQHLPIVSHWGITGGNFHEEINVQKRAKFDLNFIQSCFAFTNTKQSPLAQRVFQQLIEQSQGVITKIEDLTSAVGFIHAYDLTKLLIQAIQQTGLTGDIKHDRNAIRLALENINQPIEGLVTTYNKPFSVFDSQNNINAHEALNQQHYCMGRYGLNNEVLISHE
jgi:branched-chain amino acid transport system substrate-binding protein